MDTADQTRVLRALGFDPDALLGDTYNMVQDYCCDAMDNYNQAIRYMACDDSSYQLFSQGVDALHAKCEEHNHECLLRFEQYAQENCLSVPVGLTLPEVGSDSTQPLNPNGEESTSDQHNASAVDERALDHELQTLMEKLVRARTATDELRKEQATLQQDLAQYDSLATAFRGVVKDTRVDPTELDRITVRGRELHKKVLAVERMNPAAPGRGPVLSESAHNIDFSMHSAVAKGVSVHNLKHLNAQLKP